MGMLDEDERDEGFEIEVAKVLQRRLTEGTTIGKMKREDNVVIWQTPTGRQVFITIEAEQGP